MKPFKLKVRELTKSQKTLNLQVSRRCVILRKLIKIRSSCLKRKKVLYTEILFLIRVGAQQLEDTVKNHRDIENELKDETIVL